MSVLILAFLVAAQVPDAPIRNTLSNDAPKFPIGLSKDRQLLEDVNQFAIKDPLGVQDFMFKAQTKGEYLAIPSGTKAKLLANHKLRGPLFKEIVQVEVTDGTQKGVRGWVCSASLMTDQEFAALDTSDGRTKLQQSAYKPLYRDPAAGENAFLAPQPTMFGMVRTLIRLAVADEKAWDVFQEWQGAGESTRDAVIKRLEHKKSIFFTTVNTEVKVQKVFPEKLVNGIYPVQVELLSGQFKGQVGWAPVTVVSPVPGTSVKTAHAQAEKGKAEIQKTIELRKQRRQQRSKSQAQQESEIAAVIAREREQVRRDAQVQGQLRLQMLHQQGALAEAQAANMHANAYLQFSQALRQQQLQDSYRNGVGVAYGPNGPVPGDEYLRSQGGSP
jgi:hypothetical protein